MLFYVPTSFLSPTCTVHEWHKTSGAIMPKESEKGCLWNHFPLYLAQNWTSLITCQNKYKGHTSEVIKTFCERARMFEQVSIIPRKGELCLCKRVCMFLCLTRIRMQMCKSTTALAEKLSLKLPLWCWPCESRKDNGTSLISLFALLV